MSNTATSADVRVGTRLLDNDPRYKGKVIVVTDVVQDGLTLFAVYRTGRRIARVKFDRIFTDGLARAQGYNIDKSV